jgi:excisionase family DNA binding protein
MIRCKTTKSKETGLTQSVIGARLGMSTEGARPIAKKKNLSKEDSSGFEFHMSTGEVARLLNIHTNTVRRWSRTGILKTFRVGPRGDRRFMPRDVQRLLQKST